GGTGRDTQAGCEARRRAWKPPAASFSPASVPGGLGACRATRSAEPQARGRQALLEQGDAIVAPELLAAKDEDRHAEHLIRLGLGDARRIRIATGTLDVSQIVGTGARHLVPCGELVDRRGHLLGPINLEPALEESLEDEVREGAKEAGAHGV